MLGSGCIRKSLFYAFRSLSLPSFSILGLNGLFFFAFVCLSGSLCHSLDRKLWSRNCTKGKSRQKQKQWGISEVDDHGAPSDGISLDDDPHRRADSLTAAHLSLREKMVDLDMVLVQSSTTAGTRGVVDNEINRLSFLTVALTSL